ncbi:MAG: hypothetical protein ACLTBV_31310 [Enterocloster bolteae]
MNFAGWKKILTIRMEDGSLRHLEFESDSITSRDLRRFREYEAYLSLIYNCPVITTQFYVLPMSGELNRNSSPASMYTASR